MSSADTKALIEQAVSRISSEVPALAPLKLVFGLELRGRGGIQIYRVELPGPEITKDAGGDARVHLELPRADFNELATKGTIEDWQQAFQTGHAKASGDGGILKLIANVVARQDERNHTSMLR
jgi:hypothetical protein